MRNISELSIRRGIIISDPQEAQYLFTTPYRYLFTTPYNTTLFTTPISDQVVKEVHFNENTSQENARHERAE